MLPLPHDRPILPKTPNVASSASKPAVWTYEIRRLPSLVSISPNYPRAMKCDQLLKSRFFSATTGKAGFGRHHDDVSASLDHSLAEINPALKPNVVATGRDCLQNDWTWLSPRPYCERTWSQDRYRANGGWPDTWPLQSAHPDIGHLR
jgi:hypothetical protein